MIKTKMAINENVNPIGIFGIITLFGLSALVFLLVFSILHFMAADVRGLPVSQITQHEESAQLDAAKNSKVDLTLLSTKATKAKKVKAAKVKKAKAAKVAKVKAPKVVKAKATKKVKEFNYNQPLKTSGSWSLEVANIQILH